MNLTIGKKLAFGIGIVLGVFCLFGAIIFSHTQTIAEKIREIAEVDEPASSAAYEMEINMIGIGFGVLAYLNDRDRRHLDRIEKDKADFLKFLSLYEQLDPHEPGKLLLEKAKQGFTRYTALAEELIGIEDRQSEFLEMFAMLLGDMDDLLDEKIQTSAKKDTEQAQEKLSAVLEMEINAYEIAKNVTNYMNFHDSIYEDKLYRDINHFLLYHTIYRKLKLSPEERLWEKQIEQLFWKSVELAKGIILLDKEKKNKQALFVQVRREMDVLLDDEIQLLTSQFLKQAKDESFAALRKANVLIVALIAVFLVFGIVAGIIYARSITGPVNLLVTATQSVAKGDLDQRVNISTTDELAILGASFNKMTEDLKKITVSRNYVENIIQSMLEALFVLAPNRRIQTVNHASSHLLGYSESELGEMKFGQLVDELYRDELIRSIEEQQIIKDLEIRLVSKSGRKIPVLFSCSAMNEVDGGIKGTTCVAQDISRIKQAEERIRNQNVLLEQAIRETQKEMESLMEQMVRQEKLAMIGQISGSIAHELRNPLGAIRQSVFFLKRFLTTAKIESSGKIMTHLELIDGEVEISSLVIANLLKMAKSDPPEYEDVDLAGVISEAEKRCHLYDRLELNVNLSPETIMIRADPVQLQQVFINLFNNAAEACLPNGIITVSANLLGQDNMCVIQVHDNGKGIDSNALKQIFQPLFTLKHAGTGLGLSICKKIIESHKGRISLTSKVNEGTTVEIELPVNEQ